MRPFNRHGNRGRGGSGSGGGRGGGNAPIMSEHLRDLDLELELLKRKREMIEKQQNLLNQQQAFNREAYNYEQPQPFNDGPQFSGSNQAFSGPSRDYSHSNHDFVQLYDEPQQSLNQFPRQSAKKRLGDYVWSNPPNSREFGFEPPAKKSFSPPKQYLSRRGNFVPPSERPAFTPFKKRGLKPSQRFREPPQKPRPNDFKPTKVTKPKVATANQPTFHHVAAPKPAEVPQILQPGQAPTHQMLGRMEMALGAIIKDVKDKFSHIPQYSLCFSDAPCLKEVKRIIRERVRELLIGKPVGKAVQIVGIYRETYPVSTDKDIVTAAMKMKQSPNPVSNKNSTTFIMDTAPVNPYHFFKRNYVRLMSSSLNKLFAKLVTIAKQESALVYKLEEQNKSEASNEAVEAADKSTDAETPKEDNGQTTESNEENSADNPADTSVEIIDEESVVIDVDKKSAENVETPKKVIVVESEEEKEKLQAIQKKYAALLDDVMMQRLSMWLPRLKTQIMNVLANEISFERAKQAIMQETKVRLNSDNEPSAPVSDISKEQGLVAKPRGQLQYYVKIQGRPMLPKKYLMSPFLEQFNPKMVKKIKNVRNLLYVGFDNKDDFERIVAANGTVIGTDKIIIKISQWSAGYAGSGNNSSTPNTSTFEDKDVTMKDDKDVTAKDDKDVSQESNELNDTLNDQIDELLTSIRNEEEEVEKNGDNNDSDAPTANVDGENVAENSENSSENVEMTEQADEVAYINEGDETNGNEETPEVSSENTGEIPEEINEQNEETPEVSNEKNGEMAEGNDDKNGEDTVGDKEEVNKEKDGETAENKDGEANDVEKTEGNDKVEEIKSQTGRSTPVRKASARLASTPGTPSTVRTRRASKLAQN